MPEIILDIGAIIDNQIRLNDCTTNSFKASLNFILRSNGFIFNKQLYKQSRKTPVDSPVSSLIVELKLRPLKRMILGTYNKEREICVHYLDDV